MFNFLGAEQTEPIKREERERERERERTRLERIKCGKLVHKNLVR